MFKDTIKLTYRPSKQTVECPINFLLLILELLFTLFEPLIGSNSIQYANGLDWEERRKWLYPTLRGKSLEDYIPIFIKVHAIQNIGSINYRPLIIHVSRPSPHLRSRAYNYYYLIHILQINTYILLKCLCLFCVCAYVKWPHL